MALPTTNLTFHADASVDTDLWTVNTVGVFSIHPADNGETKYWDDVEHADIAGKLITTGPTWRSGTPLMLNPCLDFDGSTMSYSLSTNAGTNKALSNIITNSAFTVLASVYVEGITANQANPYDNDGILMDSGGYWGIHAKNNADPHILFYNWDGNADVISLAISLNTSYVLMFRHEGGNIYASLDGGSESSAASGNTADLTGVPRIGETQAGTHRFYNGRMGELAVWNAALTGSDLTDAISYFTAKWLASSQSVVPVLMRQYRQRWS